MPNASALAGRGSRGFVRGACGAGRAVSGGYRVVAGDARATASSHQVATFFASVVIPAFIRFFALLDPLATTAVAAKVLAEAVPHGAYDSVLRLEQAKGVERFGGERLQRLRIVGHAPVSARAGGDLRTFAEARL